MRGSIPLSYGIVAGVSVNGTAALVSPGAFAAYVPIDSTVTALTAVATDEAGNELSHDTIPVTVQIPDTPSGVAAAAFVLVGGYVHFCLYEHGYRWAMEGGSWQGDAYATAVALQALFALEHVPFCGDGAANLLEHAPSRVEPAPGKSREVSRA